MLKKKKRKKLFLLLAAAVLVIAAAVPMLVIHFSKAFTAQVGKWIGAKVGLFCTRPWKSNDSGWLETDWFRITRK